MNTIEEQRQRLIAAYKEALSDDEKLVDYYQRQWVETKTKEQFYKLTPKWRERIQNGSAKLELTEEPPTLAPEQLATLREFFSKRLAELEQDAARE